MFSRKSAAILPLVIALFLFVPLHSWGIPNEAENSASATTAYAFLKTANMESIKGNQDAARKAYMEAEKLYRHEQDWPGLAKVLLGVGNMESIGGNQDAARKAYMEAEKLYRSEQDWPGLAKVLHGIAELESWGGNAEKSLEIYNELARIHNKINVQYKQVEIEQASKEYAVIPDDKIERDVTWNLSDFFLEKIPRVILAGIAGALIALIICFKLLIRRFKG